MSSTSTRRVASPRGLSSWPAFCTAKLMLVPPFMRCCTERTVYVVRSEAVEG